MSTIERLSDLLEEAEPILPASPEPEAQAWRAWWPVFSSD